MSLGVLLDEDTLGPALSLERLQAALPRWRFFGNTSQADVSGRIGGASVVVSNKASIDAHTIESSETLRLICVAATGTNNVDLRAARERGIAVCNVRAHATPSVVQHTFALILALRTRLIDYHAAVTRGAWQRSELFCLFDYPIAELAGQTLGIVGYGELGCGVARIAEAFGMQVCIALRPEASPDSGRAPLHELLPQVDVLSIHCPLTPQTKGMIGATELALMKPNAILVNTARGGIVDEAALAVALRHGQLGGAAVDVLTQEPPTDGNPLLAGDIPNLIVTPHTAWASQQTRQRVVDEVARNIEAFLQGTPRNLVQLNR